MDKTTILDNIRNAVHDDSDLQSWCTTNYSRNHKVYVGVDTRKPPGESDCPYVFLWLTSQDEGYDEARETLTLQAAIVINDDSTKTIAGRSNAIEYTGVSNIETAREYLLATIEGQLGSYVISRVHTEYLEIDYFPYFGADMTITITDEYSQGDDVFE